MIHMKLLRPTKFAIISVLAFTGPSFAQDAGELREPITCSPAKGILKFLGKFETIAAKNRDTVMMVPEAKVTVNDGGGFPDRFFARDSKSETSFEFDPDGTVLGFEKIITHTPEAELCIEDKARAGTPKSDDAFSMAMGADIRFRENTGYHDMATLEDGLKDGKIHYKKMVPGPMRVLVPTFSHVMINYDDEDVTPQFNAMKGQSEVTGLASDVYCKQTIIKVDDIQALGADGLKVSGGGYVLLPVPNKKMLERFVGCQADDAGAEE